MAFAAVGTFVTDGNKVAATSRTVAISTTIEADNLAVLCVACDNLTTTDGNTNDITSVTDVRGNTWVKAREYTNGNGAAGAGVTVAIFYCVPTTQITAGDNITVNFSGSVAAKPFKGFEFTKGAGTTISVDGTADEAVDAGDPGSITLTGSSSGEHLWVRACGGETATTTFSASSGYTKVNAAATSGSTSDTNIVVGWEFKIATGTGSGASNPTCSTADWASVMVGLIEGTASQSITGAGFTNSQSFGAGTISTSNAIAGAGFTNSQSFGAGTVSTSNAIAGAGFTNSQSFGAGTVSATYDITGAGFTNSQSFGSGTVANAAGSQSITGAGFTNTSLFGSGTVSGADTDVAIPLLDRRTLRKLKKRFVAEESDRALRAKIRQAFENRPELTRKILQVNAVDAEEKMGISTSVPDSFHAPFVDAPQIDWNLFDSVLSRIQVAALQSQRLALIKQMEKQEAIRQYEALVQAEFQKAYQREIRRQKDNKILEMILPLLF